jgi:hypothetical protein
MLNKYKYKYINLNKNKKVSITLDRYLTVKFRAWKSNYFKGHRVYIYATCLLLLLAAFNLNQIFTNGYVTVVNGTEKVGCYGSSPIDSSWYNTWGKVHTFTYSIVPFVILLVFNILLILEVSTSRVSQSSANSSSSRKKVQMSVTVIVLAVSFIVLTLPGAVISGFFFGTFIVTNEGYFLILLLDSITFSYHAFSFFILYFSNKKFSEVLKSFSSLHIYSKFTTSIIKVSEKNIPTNSNTTNKIIVNRIH